MKKLPPSYMRFALPLALTLLMTFLVSGVATFAAIDFADGVMAKWMSSWMVSWAIAFPTMFFMMPVVHRLLSNLIVMEGEAAPALSALRSADRPASSAVGSGP